MLPDIAPMLATAGQPPEGELDRWAVEPKFDGWRARVLIDGELMVVRSRPGRIITASVPELAPLRALAARVLLDGELIIGGGRMAEFYGLSGRLSGPLRAVGEPVQFVAFDLVWADGEDLTSQAYRTRRGLLEHLGSLTGLVQVTSRYPGTDLADVLAACEAHGMEGVVAKRLDSPYRAGLRSTDWRKIKCTSWAEHRERRFSFAAS